MVSLWCLSVAALVGESLALNINGQPQQLEVADCSNVMDLAQFCQELQKAFLFSQICYWHFN